MPSGAVARTKLVKMRAELIAQLDLGVDGGTIALLGSVQLAISAIDNVGDDSEDRLTLMPIREHSYTEIFENLGQRGYERVLIGENGEIDLKGVRLILLHN